ncbi:hypothetical protein MRB53_039592 [Persea americana]|nr:hypothetical protein MRB53_039592 [Persea americana]
MVQDLFTAEPEPFALNNAASARGSRRSARPSTKESSASSSRASSVSTRKSKQHTGPWSAASEALVAAIKEKFYEGRLEFMLLMSALRQSGVEARLYPSTDSDGYISAMYCEVIDKKNVEKR